MSYFPITYCFMLWFILVTYSQTQTFKADKVLEATKFNKYDTLKEFLSNNVEQLENVEYIYDKLTTAQNKIDLNLLLKTREVDLRELLQENQINTMSRTKLINLLRETKESQIYAESNPPTPPISMMYFLLNLQANQPTIKANVKRIKEAISELTIQFNNTQRLIDKQYNELHKMLDKRKKTKQKELNTLYVKAKTYLTTQLTTATKSLDSVETSKRDINHLLTSDALNTQEKHAKFIQIFQEAQTSWNIWQDFINRNLSIYTANLRYKGDVERFKTIIKSGDWDFVSEGILQLKWHKRPHFNNDESINISVAIQTDNKHLFGTEFTSNIYKINSKMRKIKLAQVDFVLTEPAVGSIYVISSWWKPAISGKYVIEVRRNDELAAVGIFNASVHWNCQDKHEMIIVSDDCLTVSNKYHAAIPEYYYLVRANIGYTKGVQYYTLTLETFGKTVILGSPFIGFVTKDAPREIHSVELEKEDYNFIYKGELIAGPSRNIWGCLLIVEGCELVSGMVLTIMLDVSKGVINVFRNGHPISTIEIGNKWNRIDKLYPAIYMSQSRGIKFVSKFNQNRMAAKI
eukprot:206534_1